LIKEQTKKDKKTQSKGKVAKKKAGSKESESDDKKASVKVGVTLSESWMYFPLAAGGLGLFNPILELTSFVPEQSIKTSGSLVVNDDEDPLGDDGHFVDDDEDYTWGSGGGQQGGRQGGRGRGRGRGGGSRTRAQGYRSRTRYRNEIDCSGLVDSARQRHILHEQEFGKKDTAKPGDKKKIGL